MKFRCVQCDEPMPLARNGAAEQGGRAVVFACPGCGWEVAMLANAAETAVASSFGLTIGDGTDAASGALDAAAAGGQCPFTGVAAEADTATAADAPAWTQEAEAVMGRVPDFVRPMARRTIERYAQGLGHTTITEAVVQEARAQVGM